MDISLIGVVGALVMYGVSVSPSLLARSWQWHAVASGVLCWLHRWTDDPAFLCLGCAQARC